MIQSRWNIVAASFLAGVLVSIFIYYTFADHHTDTRAVVRMTQSLRRAGKSKLAETKEDSKVDSEQHSSLLKTVPTYAERLTSSSFTEVEDSYYNRLNGVHVKCNHTPHVGQGGDGGWEVCMAPGFKPQKPCLVYSFGVNGVWGFDEVMARDHGCVVRAFDPSMRDNDHVHQPGPVYFYKLGLGGSDATKPNGWKIHTLQSLLKKFNESDRTLDLVKIDIEYSEWDSFESMLKTGVLKRTKQLVFETHTSDVVGALPSKDTFLRYHKIMDGIEAHGFRRFFRHDNLQGVGPVTSTRSRSMDPAVKKSANLRRTCCHELYYVNLKLVKNTAGLTPA